MYDDAVYAGPFRYQLAMFGIRVLIWLFGLLHAHIAYKIYTYKIIAAFFRISNSFVLFDTFEFNRLLRSNNKMYDDAISGYLFRYQFTMFEVFTLTGLSGLLHTHVA